MGLVAKGRSGSVDVIDQVFLRMLKLKSIMHRLAFLKAYQELILCFLRFIHVK